MVRWRRNASKGQLVHGNAVAVYDDEVGGSCSLRVEESDVAWLVEKYEAESRDDGPQSYASTYIVYGYHG